MMINQQPIMTIDAKKQVALRNSYLEFIVQIMEELMQKVGGNAAKSL